MAEHLVKRPYQVQCKNSIKEHYDKGVTKQLIVAATGVGKRLMAVDLMRHFKRSLFIAHREELIMQAHDEIQKFFPFEVGIVKGPVFEIDKRIVVASVQTLNNRLARIDPSTFDLIIIDESHHYAATSFMKVARHWKPKLLTGWTATPKRLDGLSLSNLFEKIVFEYNIEDGIKDGFLAPIEAYQIKTVTTLAGVKKVAGDFNRGQLSQAVDSELRNGLIVAKYRQYCEGRQFIAYCVDINHAYHLRDMFREYGYSCDAVSSDLTRGDDRGDSIRKFKNGEILGLINCEILTEGFDYSDIGCILMGRPTLSETLYKQMLGRGTRIKSQAFVETFKTDDCIILDFVDNTGKNSLVNAYELEKDKEIEDRLFLPKEYRDKLLDEARIRRERMIKIETGKDKRIDLLKLPDVKVWDTAKMAEPATIKQVEWLQSSGIYCEDTEYTKKQASELISSLPCQEWQIRYLAVNGYDVSKGACMGQYQRVKYGIDSRQKFAISDAERRKALNSIKK